MKKVGKFSLLTLLIMIAVCAVWLGRVSNHAVKIRRAVNRLSAAGCDIGYDFEYDGLRRIPNPEPPAPKFLTTWIGNEYFVDVVVLSFQSNRSTKNSDLIHAKELSSVRRLDLDYTEIDDISIVSHLKQLLWLDLEETKVSSDDIQHIKDLRNLTILVLTRNEIGDNGVEYLKDLQNLNELRLNETDVSDACIPFLLKLKKLRKLELRDTSVSAEGVETLRTGLPNCSIEWDEGT